MRCHCLPAAHEAPPNLEEQPFFGRLKRPYFCEQQVQGVHDEIKARQAYRVVPTIEG